MKVLVSAFSCCPGRGSEPGIGWNWVEQISRAHEVWLLTTDEFQAQIASAVSPAIHAIFIPSFKLWQQLRNLPIPGLDWVYYYWWQWKAYRVGRRLHLQQKFQLVHHVTFGSWRAPSFLCLLRVPFIWGPIGGGESLPHAFWKELGWKGRVYERIRHWFQRISRWDPFVRLTINKAAAILVANRDTAAILPGKAGRKTRRMPNAGISGTDLVSLSSRPEQAAGPFQVLFAGMLEPRKGTALLLHGFALLAKAHPESKLCIAGMGPELPQLTGLADRLGISGQVEFSGWIQRDALLKRMHAADVFVLPSLRDSGGFVLLEAMLAQKPVVCLDLGGPGELVTEHEGIKVAARTPEQVYRDIGQALIKLFDAPQLRSELGLAGRRRVLENFDWNKKGEIVLALYNDLAHKTTGRASENSVT